MANPVAAGWALSYVNRVQGQVHLSVHLPNYPPEADQGGARIKIQRGQTSFVTPATISDSDGKMMLNGTFREGQPGNGLWELSISAPKGAPFKEAVARICIADPNPISLLVIEKTHSFVPRPRHTLSTKQRTAHSLGLVADRLLAELPPDRARKARQSLRKAARKILAD